MCGLSIMQRKIHSLGYEKLVLKRTSKQVNKNQMIGVFHDVLKTNSLQGKCEYCQKNKQIIDKSEEEG